MTTLGQWSSVFKSTMESDLDTLNRLAQRGVKTSPEVLSQAAELLSESLAAVLKAEQDHQRDKGAKFRQGMFRQTDTTEAEAGESATPAAESSTLFGKSSS